LGWKSSFGTGKGGDAIGSGLEVTWTSTPTKWSSNFFWNLFSYEWELTKSRPVRINGNRRVAAGAGTVPDAHDQAKRHAPAMLTTDLSLAVRPSTKRSQGASLRTRTSSRTHSPGVVKLTHRGYGSRARYLGPEVPAKSSSGKTRSPRSITRDRWTGHCLPQGRILASGLSVSQLVSTAWASASTFRGSDKRGGSNGARVRLAPQKGWEVNPAGRTGESAETLEGIQTSSTARSLAARRSRLLT